MSGYLLPIAINKAAMGAEWPAHEKTEGITITAELECMTWPFYAGVAGEVEV